ncbi:MAG: ABC transporter ATP-binding protein [Patescibacteria group bacterium]|jgi:lipopolysaccharide transport system ATP-binding protein
MNKPVITIEHVSKRYSLNRVALDNTLRDKITHALYKRNEPKQSAKVDFLALQDINLTVQQGETLGIIGRNGAGKSTLLKVLSQITPPTAGKITLCGRVASLLEVGTGFHPELTGRENIFLNGAILGMTRKEINKKFNDIVTFAEIEQFIDTPVKRYSSGMYVRLAFAVAAQLEPEILIIDEVLAVGDIQFQKKCLGKMGEAGKQGRTVIFVSHNMNAIEQLCRSCVWLDHGMVKAHSNNDVSSVIKAYVAESLDKTQATQWVNNNNEFANQWFTPCKFYLADAYGKALILPHSNNKEAWVHIEGDITESDTALTIGYAIYSMEGNLLYWSYQTDQSESQWPKLKLGKIKLRSALPQRFLNEGDYRIELISSLHFRQWLCEPGVHTPTIFLSIQGGLSDSPYWLAKRPGLLAPVLPWEQY